MSKGELAGTRVEAVWSNTNIMYRSILLGLHRTGLDLIALEVREGMRIY